MLKKAIKGVHEVLIVGSSRVIVIPRECHFARSVRNRKVLFLHRYLAEFVVLSEQEALRHDNRIQRDERRESLVVDVVIVFLEAEFELDLAPVLHNFYAQLLLTTIYVAHVVVSFYSL